VREMTLELAPAVSKARLARNYLDRNWGPCVHALTVHSKLYMPRCNNLGMLLLAFNHIYLLFALRHGIIDPRLFCRECLRCQFANAPC
jgi:hypothetical protein